LVEGGFPGREEKGHAGLSQRAREKRREANATNDFVRPLSLFVRALSSLYLGSMRQRESHVDTRTATVLLNARAETGEKNDREIRKRENEKECSRLERKVNRQLLPVFIFFFVSLLSLQMLLIPRLLFTMGSSLSTRAVASLRTKATDVANATATTTTAAAAEAEETATKKEEHERETSTSPAAATTAARPPPLAPPQEPGPEDCCQSGCQECVWEVYYRERRAHEKALAERESGGAGGGAGGDAAAPAAAAADAAAPSSSAAAVALDAFAALEAKLAKQEAERKQKAAAESAL